MRERGGEEGSGRASELGLGEGGVGPHGGEGKEELGWAMREGRGKEKGQVGPSCKEEKGEGKRKERVGRTQLEKEREK
jgi:hypothetical protein